MIVYFDQSDPALAQAVRIVNDGGDGGAGGNNAWYSSDGRGGSAGPLGVRPGFTPVDASVLFADEIKRGFPIVRTSVAAQ